MVLSETRGLRLSWVIPGCIGLTRRLGAQRQLVYRRFGYLPWNPSISRTDWPPPNKITGDGWALHRDAQAACNFSFSASKSSPFFQSVSVMAAILRASVRRAMVGFVPLASEAFFLIKLLQGSGPLARGGSHGFGQTFQIVVMILIETADGKQFLGASQLSFHIAVFRTDASLQSQSAVSPQLALGAKSMGV